MYQCLGIQKTYKVDIAYGAQRDESPGGGEKSTPAPGENMNYAWVTMTGRQWCQGCCSVWKEAKQAEARRRTSQAPAPSRGRLAHCDRGKQSESLAGRGRAGPGLPRLQVLEESKMLMGIIASGKRENTTKHRVLWERRPAAPSTSS